MSAVGDFLQLTKPRVILLAALISAAAYWMAVPNEALSSGLLITFGGSFLTGAAASVFNQILERAHDAKMKRTESRPLAAGRISVWPAIVFGSVLAISGIGLLGILRNALAGALGLLTLAGYLGLYTPLKRHTTWNTIIGALPGALPCLMGWASAKNQLDPEAFMLFAILFLWQMPHFFAIAWVYRDQYRSAGFHMLSRNDLSGIQTSTQILIFSILLVAASLAPFLAGWAGGLYMVCALSTGITLLFLAIVLAATHLRYAKGFATLTIYYIIVLMSGLVVDRL